MVSHVDVFKPFLIYVNIYVHMYILHIHIYIYTYVCTSIYIYNTWWFKATPTTTAATIILYFLFGLIAKQQHYQPQRQRLKKPALPDNSVCTEQLRRPSLARFDWNRQSWSILSFEYWMWMRTNKLLWVLAVVFICLWIWLDCWTAATWNVNGY